jgi:hypothetical protein
VRTASLLCLKLPFFKRVICNHRIFIDKKYKKHILEQGVVIMPGCRFFPIRLTPRALTAAPGLFSYPIRDFDLRLWR